MQTHLTLTQLKAKTPTPKKRKQEVRQEATEEEHDDDDDEIMDFGQGDIKVCKGLRAQVLCQVLVPSACDDAHALQVIVDPGMLNLSLKSICAVKTLISNAIVHGCKGGAPTTIDVSNHIVKWGTVKTLVEVAESEMNANENIENMTQVRLGRWVVTVNALMRPMPC